MDVLSSGFTVVAFLALLLPGLVFIYARIHLTGYTVENAKLDQRIVRALVVSAAFDAVYLAVATALGISGGDLVTVSDTSVDIRDPWLVAAAVGIGGIAVPALAAWGWTAAALRTAQSDGRLHRWVGSLSRHSPTPTAWDHTFALSGIFVATVRRPDAPPVVGLWDADSAATTYPNGRDLYLTYQYDPSTGKPKARTAGVWIDLPEGSTVELVRLSPAASAHNSGDDMIKPDDTQLPDPKNRVVSTERIIGGDQKWEGEPPPIDIEVVTQEKGEDGGDAA